MYLITNILICLISNKLHSYLMKKNREKKQFYIIRICFTFYFIFY